jgi:hypothetical protein
VSPQNLNPNPLLAQILLLLQPTTKTHKNPIARNRRHSAANPQHHLLWKFEHKTYPTLTHMTQAERNKILGSGTQNPREKP